MNPGEASDGRHRDDAVIISLSTSARNGRF